MGSVTQAVLGASIQGALPDLGVIIDHGGTSGPRADRKGPSPPAPLPRERGVNPLAKMALLQPC